MAVDAGRYSRSLRNSGRLTSELRQLQRVALERELEAPIDGRDADDTIEAPVAILAEGTGATRAVADADDLTDLVQELVTPLTVLLAAQQRMVSAVSRRGDAELLAELRRYDERGQEAMAAIHRVLAELRARTP